MADGVIFSTEEAKRTQNAVEAFERRAKRNLAPGKKRKEIVDGLINVASMTSLADVTVECIDGSIVVTKTYHCVASPCPGDVSDCGCE